MLSPAFPDPAFMEEPIDLLPQPADERIIAEVKNLIEHVPAHKRGVMAARIRRNLPASKECRIAIARLAPAHANAGELADAEMLMPNVKRLWGFGWARR